MEKEKILPFMTEEAIEEMKKGYIFMAEINKELANQGFIADNEQLLSYEEKLSESE